MVRRSLIFILLLAGILRVFNLTAAPPDLSLDETSLAYNAYSISETGRDEYGTKLPLVLRAYDDWRPGFYVYLLVPLIKLFGLNALTVRLPSVLLSLGVVYLTYLLFKEILAKNKIIPLLGAMLLAISPWQIYLSRLSHEANLGLFLFLSGGYFLLRSLNRSLETKSLSLSGICYVLALNSYQSEKVIVPVFLIGVLLIYRREFVANWKKIIIPAIISILLAIPLIWQAIQPESLIRFQGTSVFTNHPLYTQAAGQFLAAKNQQNWLGMLLFNYKITTSRIFFENYFVHFSPGWLFFGQTFESHKVPNLGLLYWWEFITVIIGLIGLWKIRLDRKIKWFIILWLFTAPIPAALTTQAPHAMRSYTMLPVWQLFSAYGLFKLFQVQSKIFTLSLCLVITGSVVFFGRQYFYVFPVTQSQSFQTALHQAMRQLSREQNQYSQVIVSNRDNLYQSYMFYLYESRFEPKRYLSTGGTKSGGFAQTHQIANIQFRPIVWQQDQKVPNTLLIGNPNEFPGDMETNKIDRYLDNTKGVISVLVN